MRIYEHTKTPIATLNVSHWASGGMLLISLHPKISQKKFTSQRPVLSTIDLLELEKCVDTWDIWVKNLSVFVESMHTKNTIKIYNQY